MELDFASTSAPGRLLVRPRPTDMRRRLEMAEWADGLGCLSIAVSEHHGSADGYLPSPDSDGGRYGGAHGGGPLFRRTLIAPFRRSRRLAEDMDRARQPEPGARRRRRRRRLHVEEFAITVLPTAPVTADRTLSIEILRGRPPTEGYDLRVVRDLENPAGSTGRTMTISVPEVAGSTHYRVNVSEDGTLLGALSVPWTASRQRVDRGASRNALPGKEPAGHQRVGRGAAPRQPPLLGYGAVAFGVFVLATSGGRELADGRLLRPVDRLQRLRYRLPVAGAACGLGRIAAGGAPRLAAWTAAGGNLWVYGVGEQWEHLPELEKILDLLSDRGPTGPAPPGWTAPEKGLYGRTPEAAETSEDDDEGNPVIYRNGRRVAARPAKRSPAGPKTPLPTPPQRPSFVFRPMQAGLVVALASEQPFPGTAADWRWVLDSMGDSRWHWYERHGLSLKRENPDYWNFLIPGVGVAPVTQFCVLITVFVIGIGPVNYWLLRRRRQLHLLLLTIPASAAAVTLLLFAYALMADGLDVRVRARSVTHLDQRSGRAVCWTRLSYFAGLTPRGGLRFPADTLVLPLEQMPGRISREQPLFREVLWDEDQRFSSGWIASRTPAQFSPSARGCPASAWICWRLGQGEGPCRAEPPANADQATAGADQGREILPRRCDRGGRHSRAGADFLRRRRPACWR